MDFLPILPESGRDRLSDLLSAPVLDRALVWALADRREEETRSAITERTARLKTAVCGQPDREAWVEGYKRELDRQNTLYQNLTSRHADMLRRRLRVELREKELGQAMALLSTALTLQEERRVLTQRHYRRALETLDRSDGCSREMPALPDERLVVPLIRTWYELARILSPEKRFAVFGRRSS